jgi:hypothetical protein
VGRKPIELDLKQLQFLAGLHCSKSELAEHFGVDEKTIRNKLRQEPYRSAWLRGRAEGRIALRQMQFRAADRGNPAMLIWLGKQMLDQAEPSSLDVRRLNEAANQLIEAVMAVAKSHVPAERWDPFCRELRRYAEQHPEELE